MNRLAMASHWVLVCAGFVVAAVGCGQSPPSQPQPPQVSKSNPAAEETIEDSDALRKLSVTDQSANEMLLPEERDENTELLSGSVKPASADYRRPFLATVRVEHGGRVTTGSVLHSSPKYGTYILTCRHGREEGGSWVARCSGGAMVYGEKYVTSKNSDLCLLKAPGQYDLGNVRPVPVRVEGVESPEPCLSIGYDNPLGGGKFASSAGDKLRAWTEENPDYYNKSRDGFPLICAKTASGPGRSGGGLFMVSTSELVGVCSYKDGIGVHFVGRRSVLSFLNRCRELGHIPWWTDVEVPPPNVRPFPEKK